MKTLAAIAAAALIALTAPFAAADDDDRRRGKDRDHWRGPAAHGHWRGDDHRGGDHRGGGHRADWRDDRRGAWREPDRGPRHGFERGGRAYDKGYRDGWRAAPPRWSRGQHLRGGRYVVIDHRRHGWRAPRRGEAWVQIDRDILLVALGTGLIIDVLGR